MLLHSRDRRHIFPFGPHPVLRQLRHAEEFPAAQTVSGTALPGTERTHRGGTVPTAPVRSPAGEGSCLRSDFRTDLHLPRRFRVELYPRSGRASRILLQVEGESHGGSGAGLLHPALHCAKLRDDGCLRGHGERGNRLQQAGTGENAQRGRHPQQFYERRPHPGQTDAVAVDGQRNKYALTLAYFRDI